MSLQLNQLWKGNRFFLPVEEFMTQKADFKTSLDLKTSTVKLSNSLLFQGGPNTKKNSL